MGTFLLLRLLLPFAPLCLEAGAGTPSSFIVCRAVAREAAQQGVSPPLAVSLAWHESRFRDGLVSRAGAVGPLQVLPRYWCPKDGPCDLVEAGVRALKVWLASAGHDPLEAVSRFNGGYEYRPRSRRYAMSVMARARSLAN